MLSRHDRFNRLHTCGVWHARAIRRRSPAQQLRVRRLLLSLLRLRRESKRHASLVSRPVLLDLIKTGAGTAGRRQREAGLACTLRRYARYF